MARDKSTREAAIARVHAQLPIAEKVKYADEIIENSDSIEYLEMQVQRLLVKLSDETRWTWMLCWLIPPVGISLALWTLCRRYISHRGFLHSRSD